MRLKNDTNNFAASFNTTPPYQMLVLHSKMLIYPRELYQRGVQRKRVEMIAADFNEYVANEPKVSFRKPVTSCKSSRNTPERANLIFCWCSCSTVSDASQMKRHLS